MAQEKPASLSPDRDVIKQHLEFIVSGMGDYCDGRLEVSGLFTSNTENFALSAIEKAVDYAVKRNSAGENTYLVGALLDPDAFPVGRSCDDDFYATSVLWADIDEPHDPAALKALYAVCPPNRAVVTARTPHRRIQLWWKLSEAVTDSDTVREALTGIQQALNGDRAVKNPTSLMRLAGTVNYPTDKKRAAGRVTEQTEYIVIGEKAASIEKIMAAYPVKDYAGVNQHQPRSGDTDYKYAQSGNPFDQPKIDDGREKKMSAICFASILHLTAAHGAFPTVEEVMDDAWPVYVKAVTPRGGRTLDQDGRGAKAMRQKIASKLRQFENGGMARYGMGTLEDTIEQGRKTMSGGKDRARKPDGGADQEGETEEKKADETYKPITATAVESLDLDNIPPREFLYHNLVARKFVSMLVAPPGVGKSMATLHIAVSAATANPWGEWGPLHCKPLNVWMYNNEEGCDELRRRLKGVMIAHGVVKDDFKGRLFIDSGENRAISLAKSKDGEVISTPDYDALVEEILNRKIDLLIIDPFAETHSVNENSNDEIKRVTAMYREIAFRANCAVLLVHHARKGMENSSENAGNAEMARGGGAQIGVIRRAFTMSHMSTQEAAKFNVPEEKRRWFIRMDDAKTNITAPATATDWFRLRSQDIGNGDAFFPEGDSIGVLDHIKIQDVSAEFADSMKEERLVILTLLARIMIDSDVESLNISTAVKLVISSGYNTYKSRKLHDFIAQSVDDYGQVSPVTCEGFKCIMALEKGKSKKEGDRIILQKHQIMRDF